MISYSFNGHPLIIISDMQLSFNKKRLKAWMNSNLLTNAFLDIRISRDSEGHRAEIGSKRGLTRALWYDELAPIAQLVEHLTLNQVPRITTNRRQLPLPTAISFFYIGLSWIKLAEFVRN